MTHNTRVTILAMAMGMTFGVGTLILLFYNGVILGAVATDYVVGHQAVFLAGWLLPHGAIEIPAILLGGQAGFILAGALIGWADRTSLVWSVCARWRAIWWRSLLAPAYCSSGPELWRRSCRNILHQPVVPYALKIAFGLCELAALSFLLGWVGRE